MSPTGDRRWLTLAIVGAAFFMTVLDVAIVNVALPSIQTDLHVAETTVQWVLIAYAITFGGFLLLGGRMADLLGRKRIFIVGLFLFTLASLVFGLTLPFVPESRAELGHHRFDAWGAITVTGGLALLVYAISKAPDVGWGSARTILLLIASVAILALFTAIELRSRAPLMPFRIFRIRSLLAANIVGFLLGAVIFANFLVLTLYVQQVLGWSALKTGVTFLATAGTTGIWAGVAQALPTPFGPRPGIVLGLLVLALSMGWYTQIPVDGHFWPDLLPPYLIFALGLAFSFVPVTIAALAQVEAHDAGLASGLINTNQQIGGAIGVALASTIFVSSAKSLLKTGHSPAEAFTSGYQDAFWALIGLAVLGAILAFVMLRGTEAPVPEAQAETA